MPWIHINQLARTSMLKLFSGARKCFPQIGKKTQFDPLLLGERISKLKVGRTAATMGVLGIGGYAFLNDQTPAFAAESTEEQDSVPQEKEALTDNDLLRNEKEEEALLELILEGLEKIESVKGKEIILLMGATGAGKSTLVNYLLGYKMKMINGVIEVDGQALAEIGHNPVRSQTLHIGVYEQDGRVYVDCPGLLDTRTSIERIWATLSIQLVIKNAAQIKGVVLVVDYASFVLMRGKPLLDLSESLTLFFKDTQALSNCLSLVITKTEKYTVQPTSEEITNFLQSAIKEQNKKMQEIASKYGLDTYDPKNASMPSIAYKHAAFAESEDRVKYDKLQRGIKALSLIASAKITVTNLLEKQRKTAKNIQDKIDMLVAISPSKIVFERLSSRERRNFDNLIHGMASRGYRLLCKQQELLDNIKQEKYELDKPYLNTYQEIVIEYDKKIAEIVAEMDKIYAEQQTLAQQGDQEILVYKDSCDEKRNPLGILGWSFKKFEYEGQPFIKVSITKNDGSDFIPGTWFSGDGYFEDNLALDANQGVYSSIYKSAYYHDGNVLVQIIGKRKYSNDFKQKMIVHVDALIAKKEALQKNREERVEFDRTFSEEERIKLNAKRVEKIKHDIAKLEVSLSNITRNLQQRIHGFIAIQRIYELFGDYTNEHTDLMIQSFYKKLLKSELYASHAEQLYKLGRYHDAVKSYKRAIMYDEDHEGMLYARMADALSALGCFKEADDYYTKALESDIELAKRIEVDKQKLKNGVLLTNTQKKLTSLCDQNTEVFLHDPKVVEIGGAMGLFFGGLAYYYGISVPKSIAIGSVAGTVVGGGLAYQTSNQQSQQKKKSHL